MTQEGATPPNFWQRIQQMIDAGVAKAMRSGALRNASISEGGALTIKGGAFKMFAKSTGVNILYAGPITVSGVDGQDGLILKRSDGTTTLAMFDANPTDGVQQALNWFDRGGNTVFADDTNSGQGMARPYLSGGFARTRYADFTVSTTSGTFETLWDTRISKQQPRLEVAYRASMDTAGTTGEVRIMVNGVQFSSTQSESFLIATHYLGPDPVPGAHMEDLVIEIQGRRTSATGALRVEPIHWRGRQS